jgi:hypothetical protein
LVFYFEVGKVGKVASSGILLYPARAIREYIYNLKGVVYKKIY